MGLVQERAREVEVVVADVSAQAAGGEISAAAWGRGEKRARVALASPAVGRKQIELVA